MSKATILVLTDRTLEGRIIENFLQTAGYTVLNTYAPALALQPEQATRADAAIVAIDDPKSDVADTCRFLRQMSHAPHLPVIVILTEHSQNQQSSTSNPANGIYQMVRPIRLFELAEMIRQVLATRRRNMGSTRSGDGRAHDRSGYDAAREPAHESARRELHVRN